MNDYEKRIWSAKLVATYEHHGQATGCCRVDALTHGVMEADYTILALRRMVASRDGRLHTDPTLELERTEEEEEEVEGQ